MAAPPVEPPSAQHSLIQTLFPVVGSVGLLGFALIYHNRTFLYIAVAMVLLMLVFSVALRWSQKRGVRKKAAADARRHGKYLREQERALGVAGERQREALARLFPDPGRLWTLVLKRRNLWERRPGDADFLHVRLGRGTVKLDQPVELDLGHNPLTEYQSTPLHDAQRLLERRVNLRQQPVTVDLAGNGILAVTGDRSRARPWSRAVEPARRLPRAPRSAGSDLLRRGGRRRVGVGGSGCPTSEAIATRRWIPPDRRSPPSSSPERLRISRECWRWRCSRASSSCGACRSPIWRGGCRSSRPSLWSCSTAITLSMRPTRCRSSASSSRAARSLRPSSCCWSMRSSRSPRTWTPGCGPPAWHLLLRAHGP